MAPAGTSRDVVNRLNEASAKGLSKPAFRDTFATLGADVALMNPDQLARFIPVEIAKWAKLVKEAGIQPE